MATEPRPCPPKLTLLAAFPFLVGNPILSHPGQNPGRHRSPARPTSRPQQALWLFLQNRSRTSCVSAPRLQSPPPSARPIAGSAARPCAPGPPEPVLHTGPPGRKNPGPHLPPPAPCPPPPAYPSCCTAVPSAWNVLPDTPPAGAQGGSSPGPRPRSGTAPARRRLPARLLDLLSNMIMGFPLPGASDPVSRGSHDHRGHEDTRVL